MGLSGPSIAEIMFAKYTITDPRMVKIRLWWPWWYRYRLGMAWSFQICFAQEAHRQRLEAEGRQRSNLVQGERACSSVVAEG